MQNNTIVIANDHAGYDLKMKILAYFKQKYSKRKIIDCGSDSAEERVDYPDYAEKVVHQIRDGNAQLGILICASGIGMSIAANRHKGIRAALCLNDFMAIKSRAHNDANILVLGSSVTEDKIAFKIIDSFLNKDFEGGRHAIRVEKLEE